MDEGCKKQFCNRNNVTCCNRNNVKIDQGDRGSLSKRSVHIKKLKPLLLITSWSWVLARGKASTDSLVLFVPGSQDKPFPPPPHPQVVEYKVSGSDII